MNTQHFKKGDLLKKAVNEDEYSVLRVVAVSENDVMLIDCNPCRSGTEWMN